MADTGIILDLKGVCYNEIGEKDDRHIVPLPGAIEFVKYLKASDVPHVFMTNTTSKLPTVTVEEMQEIGFPISLDEVVDPISLSVLYMRQNNITSFYLISDMRELFEFYASQGFTVRDENVDAVVCALDRHMTHEKLMRPLSILRDGATLIALNKNPIRVSPGREGEIEPNIGFYVAGFEYFIGKDAVLIGKPSRRGYDLVLSKLGIRVGDYGKVVIAGDDPEADLKVPDELGMRTVFVPSAKYRSCQPLNPDLVTTNLMQVKEFFHL